MTRAFPGPQVPGMSALQAARGALAALAAPETFARGVFMARGADRGLPPPPPRRSAFRRAYEVVFVDATGWLNLAAHMSRSALAQVRAAWRGVQAGRHSLPHCEARSLWCGGLCVPSLEWEPP